MQAANSEFERLVNIMNELREKCPWDKKQTIESLRQLTIEEMYELVDAITDNNYVGIKEELGDLLLHIIFYAKIGNEKNEFSLEDVIKGICEKLILRHPHIYGDVEINTEEGVKKNWEKIKLQSGKKSVLDGVPKSLPALIKAIRLQEKTKAVGFEWENTNQVWEKLYEEISELKEAISIKDPLRIEDEFGDVLFSLVNLARFLQVDAENALEKTNKKFTKRFQGIEKMALAKNKNLSDMSLEEMDDLWNAVKTQTEI